METKTKMKGNTTPSNSSGKEILNYYEFNKKMRQLEFMLGDLDDYEFQLNKKAVKEVDKYYNKNSLNPKFDKSYARLFKAYSNLEDNTRALYFGNLLKTKFTQETLDKYKDILPKIDEIAKIENDKLEAYRAEERKKVTKGILKYAVPLAVLVGAGLIYFFYFKKK